MLRPALRILALLMLSTTLHAGEVEDALATTLKSAKAFPTAMAALQQLGPKAYEPLLALTRSADGPTSLAAWRALAHVTTHATGADRQAAARAVAAALDQGPPALAGRLIELLGLIGGDECVPVLARRLGDEALREPARAALTRLPGEAATAALAAALEGARGPWQEALIASLAARGARDALVPYLDATRPALAARALAAFGGADDRARIPALEELAQAGDPALRAAAVDALLRLAAAQPADRRDEAQRVYLLLLGRATPAQSVAALAGLGRVGDAATLPVLFGALDAADTAVRGTARQVLATVPAAGVGEAIRGRLSVAKPAAQVALLTALVQREGAGARATVEGLLTAAAPETAATAAALLGEIGDASAGERLLALAADAAHNADALRAYLRLRERLGDGLKDAYATVLRVAARDEERGLALAGLARLADPATLDLVRPYLKEGGLRRPAAEAVLAIAERLNAGGEGARAGELLVGLVGLGYREIGNRAAATLRKLGQTRDFAHDQGFLTEWQVIGCFPNPNNEAAKQAFFPETELDLAKTYAEGGQKLKWQPVHTDDVQGVVDLTRLYKGRDNVAAYAYAIVRSPAEQDVELKLGSDDGVFVWLNGKQVHANPANRGLSVDNDTVKVHLQAGDNPLLLKILQGGGGWEFCLRAFKDGKPVDLGTGAVK